MTQKKLTATEIISGYFRFRLMTLMGIFILGKKFLGEYKNLIFIFSVVDILLLQMNCLVRFFSRFRLFSTVSVC
jgi:hypothetical protein